MSERHQLLSVLRRTGNWPSVMHLHKSIRKSHPKTNMTQFLELKSATNIQDVGKILGFTASSIAYIVYKLQSDAKYTSFEIAKRSGGYRKIRAPIPPLKLLQRRVATLLTEYVTDKEETSKRAVSHGFYPNRSIITNAKRHTGKPYIFNVDLENFFPTINFGRVRGLFMNHKDFELHEDVATLLAQICCDRNQLPQGSPSSPIVSNLIGSILDHRLVGLSKRHQCIYSRYVDDITFSTRRRDFPEQIAYLQSDTGWTIGNPLREEIENSGFKINYKKISMQYRTNRQVVTGLVVNEKPNVNIQYYKLCRAMCHSLFKTGSYTNRLIKKAKNTIAESKTDPIDTIDSIVGMVSHIHNVKRKSKPHTQQEKGKDNPTGYIALYRKLLFFKYFFANNRTMLVCEGKTDNIYFGKAISQLADKYPRLVSQSENSSQLLVKFFPYTQTNSEVLKLSGGSGDLVNLLKVYQRTMDIFEAPVDRQAVIIIIDDDDGSKPIRNFLNNRGIDITKGEPFYHIESNLYIVLIAHPSGICPVKVEDLFPEHVLNREIDGRTFELSPLRNPSIKGYDKAIFAKRVISPVTSSSVFENFRKTLDRIVFAIEHFEDSIYENTKR